MSSLTGKIVASRARVNISQGPARERLEHKIRKLEEEKRATLGGLYLGDCSYVDPELHPTGTATAPSLDSLFTRLCFHAGVARGIETAPKVGFGTAPSRFSPSQDFGLGRPPPDLGRPPGQMDFHRWHMQPRQSTTQSTLRTPPPTPPAIQDGRQHYSFPGSPALACVRGDMPTQPQWRQ